MSYTIRPLFRHSPSPDQPKSSERGRNTINFDGISASINTETKKSKFLER